MDKMSLEREFELPAKALFHVMFGDKSVAFQRLYQGRRAQCEQTLSSFMFEIANSIPAAIYQGPWFSLDSGRVKRDLTYEIEHQDFLRIITSTTA